MLEDDLWVGSPHQRRQVAVPKAANVDRAAGTLTRPLNFKEMYRNTINFAEYVEP